MPTPRPSLIDRLLAEYERTGALPAIAGGDHDDDPPEGDPPADPKPPKIDWTEEQTAEIKRIAAKEAKEAARKAREQRDAELAAEKATADAEAERKRQEAAGEFDAVKTSLTQERDTAISERDTLKAEHDALTTYFATQYEATVKELPDFIAAFKPDDDASFSAKADWLAKAQDQARKFEKQSPRGNGPNPKPGSNTNIDVDKEIARKARAYRL